MIRFTYNFLFQCQNHRSRPDGVPMQDKSKGKLSGILHKVCTSLLFKNQIKQSKADDDDLSDLQHVDVWRGEYLNRYLFEAIQEVVIWLIQLLMGNLLCSCQKKPEEVKRAISDVIEKTKSKVKKAAAKNTGCSIFSQQNLNDSIQVYCESRRGAGTRKHSGVTTGLILACAVFCLFA